MFAKSPAFSQGLALNLANTLGGDTQLLGDFGQSGAVFVEIIAFKQGKDGPRSGGE